MLSAPAETIANIAGRQGSAGRPALFDRPNWSVDSPAGRLFSAASAADEPALRRACLRTAQERAGLFSPALALLPEREQERAALLLALADVLFATARGPGSAESRIEDLDRIAFAIARALRTEGCGAEGESFARRFGAESRRRGFTRRALDELFDAARVGARRRRPETGEELAIRAQSLAEVFTTALFGVEPTAAVVDLGAGLLRLLALQGLATDLRALHCALPESDLAEPVQYRTPDEIGAAVMRECAELRKLLLKGARAAGEVPLSFRRPVAFMLPVALSLLGRLEERPPELARRIPTVGKWTLRRAFWRARFTPLG
ncbi:MAG: squalene/phytoene synthase family protein [Thermoanaerobaculia bacterium]